MKQEVHCDGGQPKPGFATSLVRLRGKLVEDTFYNQFFFYMGSGMVKFCLYKNLWVSVQEKFYDSWLLSLLNQKQMFSTVS